MTYGTDCRHETLYDYLVLYDDYMKNRAPETPRLTPQKSFSGE